MPPRTTQKPTRYEYDLFTFGARETGPEIVDRLNDLGQSGWSIAGTFTGRGYILKRVLTDGEATE